MSVQTQNTNLNPYSNTPIKNLEYIQNKALVIAPFEITKSGLLDTDLMLDTPGTITMYFFRKNFNNIDKEPTAEQFKTVGTVSDISTKLGLDITTNNISSSITSSYYLGFTKISVIFKYDKNTGIRIIEKDNSLLGGNYIDISIDSSIDLTTEDYFVICNVTKNTKATNSGFTESASMDFLFMIPSSECQEIITDFDILDTNNKTINVKKYGALGSGFAIDKDTTIEPAYEADFFGDGSNIATYLFDGTCRDLNGNYNGTPTDITYGDGKVGKCALFNGAPSTGILTKNYTSSEVFAISLWINASANGSSIYTRDSNTVGQSFGLYLMPSGKFLFQNEYVSGSYIKLISNYTITLNTWVHVYVERINNTVKLYINGVLDNTSVSNNWNLLAVTLSQYPMTLGKRWYQGTTVYPSFNGKIDQVRIFNRALNQSEVTALYLNNGVPRVIKQGSNVINDNWTQIQLETVEAIDQPYIYGSSLEEQTSKTLTSVGTTLIVDDPIFSKVLKFDGSNYINISSTQDLNFGTGDFTIETWMKRSTDKIAILFQTDGSNSGGLYLCHDASGYFGFGGIITSFATLKNTWYHIAMVRKSGTYKIFINGTCYLTTTNNNSPSSGNLAIGTNSDWRPQGFEGYIYNLNIIKGEAKYQTDFKPNINFEKVVNTSLLIQPTTKQSLTIKDPKRKDFFGDKSMIACYMLDSNTKDETGFYNGTATNITYTDGKFGKCAIFNGSTSKISSDINLNSNNFSISFWGNLSNIQNTHSFILSTINGDNRYGIRMTNFGKLEPNIWTGADNVFGVDANWSNYVNTWTNYVFSIANNTCYFYINGKLKTTKTFTNNVIFNGVNIGYGEGGIYNIAGQLDNVKIFNRALTDSEVTSLYNETISPIITLETESETIASEPDFFNDKSNIATYLFDNDVNDANGKYNGTATNITYGTGKFGNCANFDGTSSINSKLDLSGLNSYTMSVWVKKNTINSHFNMGQGVLTSAGVTSTGPRCELVWYHDGYLYAECGSNHSIWNKYLPPVIDTNWHHLLYTFNNGIINMYFDGGLLSLASSSGTISTTVPIFTSQDFVIGLRSTGNTLGQIDNVRIFNRALTQTEVQDLYRETKRVKYKAITLDANNFGPVSKINIETQKEIKLLNYKTWTGTDATFQGYRIYPVMNISDHTTEETSFNPKYYLGTKYQRNLTEILSQSIKSKRTIFNLKDMYLVDDQCIQTLKKINILLEIDQMIKFSERLYNLAAPLREKLNADLILEYLSTPVTGSVNSDIAATLKTSLMEDYNFTQEEITNLNDNLNTFKSRARIALNAPVIQGPGLDQLRFNLPKTFIDNNRSKTEKKNLLVFGTDAGFNKFNLAGYTAPYSNISKRDATSALVYSDLTLGLPVIASSNNIKTLVKDTNTELLLRGSITDQTGKTVTVGGNTTLSTAQKKFNTKSIYFDGAGDYLQIPSTNFNFGSSDFTIECWINPSSIPATSTWPGIITHRQSNTLNYCWVLNFDPSGKVYFGIPKSGGNITNGIQYCGTNEVLSINNWYHIAIVKNNTSISIYLNGIFQNSIEYTNTIFFNSNPINIGVLDSNALTVNNFNGYIDDIRISKGIARYTSNFAPEVSDGFKDILTNYKQQIPFTYIPLSTDIKDINDKPVFETLTDITGFSYSDIIIDVPNVL